MNKNLIYFLISLRNYSIAKKTVLTVKNVHILVDYAYILYKEGFIQSFRIQRNSSTNENFLTVKLRQFQNKTMTENLKLVSSPSKVKVLSYSQLLKMDLKNKLLILSTSKGILSHNECLKQRLGGVAIFSC